MNMKVESGAGWDSSRVTKITKTGAVVRYLARWPILDLVSAVAERNHQTAFFPAPVHNSTASARNVTDA